MTGNESYLDIVWQQFRKNRPAYWSLWMMPPLFLLAIFAPALASNVPFVFDDGPTRLYPWFSTLFNPEGVSDFLFNMALVGFFPWLLLCGLIVMMGRQVRVEGTPPLTGAPAAASADPSRVRWSGRQRIGLAGLAYLGVIAVLATLFSVDELRPANRYQTRNFSQEEFDAPETKHGIYPPIPFGPTEIDMDAINRAPNFAKPAAECREANDGATHWLGTDKTGRDVVTMMLYGTRISMTVGFVAVSIYVTIGIIVGALAGYFGGTVDMLVSRVIEVFMLFPTFFLILTLVALLGPSIYIIMVVLGLTGWPTMARLIRGEVLKQRSIDYTMAAQALGASHWRVMFRHILPNALSPALVAAPFGIASAIITEASLSLLGFGVRPPAPTWGTLLGQAHANYHYWWLIVVPSAAIFFTVTVFNLVGSGLRDAMDPKLRV